MVVWKGGGERFDLLEEVWKADWQPKKGCRYSLLWTGKDYVYVRRTSEVTVAQRARRRRPLENKAFSMTAGLKYTPGGIMFFCLILFLEE